MDLSALGTFFKGPLIPLMKALQVSEPNHRTVGHGEDMERVLSAFHDIAFRPATEIHFATMDVGGRKVTILALQEPASSAVKPA